MDIVIWLLTTLGETVMPWGWTAFLSVGKSLDGPGWGLGGLLLLGVIYMTYERDGLVRNKDRKSDGLLSAKAYTVASDKDDRKRRMR